MLIYFERSKKNTKSQGRTHTVGARGAVPPTITVKRSEEHNKKSLQCCNLIFPFNSKSFVWRRDGIVLAGWLDCMCTFKVYLYPRSLNFATSPLGAPTGGRGKGSKKFIGSEVGKNYKKDNYNIKEWIKIFYNWQFRKMYLYLSNKNSIPDKLETKCAFLAPHPYISFCICPWKPHIFYSLSHFWTCKFPFLL